MFGTTGRTQTHHQHHHYPNHTRGPAIAPTALSLESAKAGDLFDSFIAASTFKSVLHTFRQIGDVLKLRPTNFRHFYPKLRNNIRSWKAQALWTKYDNRASHKCYNEGKAAINTSVLIIGAGPCGLRAAIEAQLLGAKVVVVEKRDRFSRNNVLHLWPFVIADLKALGAKKFYGKFCAGAIDHISIRQLQCILLKVALLLGIEVIEGVTFEKLLDPPEDQSQRTGWHARFSPLHHPVNHYEFDVLIGADGKRNTLLGFKRKEFRGKLAIAITANFINRHSEQEARVQEISGVAFIFNQKFFKELYASTGIDLENIVYYKDETHYFVMTAKKHSLLDKGVIMKDISDTQRLLHSNNVDREALCSYAREAAAFSTNYLMPHTDFAVNHYGKPDIAMFDFTSMYAADNACCVVQRHGHKLLKMLVGDSLLEPFWPTGSGCARGFLSCFDAGWAIRSWSGDSMTPIEVIAERESCYRLLGQTTPENLAKDILSYTLDPSSRYPTINLKAVLPFQVRHLRSTDRPEDDIQDDSQHIQLPRKRKRRDSIMHPDTLLAWCQKQVENHEDIPVENLDASFKNGMALCAIIHRFRPYYIDFDSLEEENAAHNNQLAFDILQKEFAISPVMTGIEMAACSVPDRLSMISYLSQVCDLFRGQIPQFMGNNKAEEDTEDLGDFPMPADDELLRTNLVKSETSRSEGNLIKCKILNTKETVCNDDLSRSKKRRNQIGSLNTEDLELPSNLGPNRAERLRKQKEQRELENIRFIRSMRLLDCQPVTKQLEVYNATADVGLSTYRQMCAMTMREKAKDLEMKIYYPDKLDRELKKSAAEGTENFSDRVKDLEDKFRVGDDKNKKPKELVRAIGKLEKSDWNMAAIEKKISENTIPGISNKTDKVPKWNREAYNDKQLSIERRLRENGEDEERIAKYLDIDASLKRMERKLKEGSTLDVGLRGHNKVSNLANQLASKLVRKDNNTVPLKQSKAVVLPSCGSDLCYFCSARVYLVERMSAEGKFFHRKCFKCSYCHALLRLGNYIYDRDGRFGGHFFCIPHFGMSPKAEHKRRELPLISYQNKTQLNGERLKGTADALFLDTAVPDCRGTTPERAEFENSVVEQSDEDEYLSEDEWTDRNFGMSANELDETDSECSDFGDDDDDEDELVYEMEYQMSAEETKRLAEKWKRRYSSNPEETGRQSDSDAMSEERGADGDESHTATEGENEDEDADDDGEAIKRARALRRQELNIEMQAPVIHTSDSGSDTEVATDDESEESDTHIDTDSDFADDVPVDVPHIIINKSNQKADISDSDEPEEPLEEMETVRPREDTDVPKPAEATVPNPHTEHLQRLLRRTESTEAMAAHRNLLLRQNYLIGAPTSAPKRSASFADVGDRFKNFMDKISATQTKLKPAPEPSAAMQAFLKGSKGSALVSAPVGFQNINYSNQSLQTASSGGTLSKEASLEDDPKLEHSPEIEPKLVSAVESPVCDEYPIREIYGTETQDDTDLADTTNVNVSRNMFGFSLDTDVVEAINEEIMTSNAQSSDDGGDDDSDVTPRLTTVETTNLQKSPVEFSPSKNNLSLDRIINAASGNKTSSDRYVDLPVEKDPAVRSPVDRLEQPLSEKDPAPCNVSLATVGRSKPRRECGPLRLSENVTEMADDSNRFKLKLQVESAVKNDVENVTELYCEGHAGQIESNGVSQLRQEPEVVTQTPLAITKTPFSLSKDVLSKPVPVPNRLAFRPSKPEPVVPVVPLQTRAPDVIPQKSATCPSLELSDGKDIDSVFDQLAGEALDDLEKMDPRSVTIGQLYRFSDNTEINFVSEDPRDYSVAAPDYKIDDPEEFIDLEEEEVSWAEDNALDSAGEELNLSEMQAAPVPKFSSKPFVAKAPVNPIDLVGSPEFEYMDTSSESSSSESTEAYSYNELEDVQSPTTGDKVMTDDVTFPIVTSQSQCSITRNLNRTIEKSVSFDHKKIFGQTPLTAEPVPDNSSVLYSYQSPGGPCPARYEGYLPRFKDRVTPFRYVRDSIDVRKSSVSKPLFAPSKEIAQQCTTNAGSRKASPPVKPKDGDLVRDMVMSRITKPDKGNRRGSRGSLLLPSGSHSSLLGDILPDTSGSLASLRDCVVANENLRGDVVDQSNENLLAAGVDQSNENLPAAGLDQSNENLLAAGVDQSNENLLGVGVAQSNENAARCEAEPRSKSIDNCAQANRNYFRKNTPTPSKPKNTLPETALTHPEKFSNDNPAGIAPVTVHARVGACDSFEYNTLDEDSHLINRKRSMARRPCRLDTFDPPPTRPPRETRAAIHLDCPVPRTGEPTSPQLEIFTATPSDYGYDRPRRASESEIESIPPDVPVDNGSRAISQWNVGDRSPSVSDKEARLKKLLCEHRQKDCDTTKTKDMDNCVRDCLEEYRLKRYSAPTPHPMGVQPSKDRPHEDIYQRTKRPSVLELEALQVFTTPAVDSAPMVLSEGGGQPPEMRKQKKSKDRERRRSLIQVVAGMFNKSDDKKKIEEKPTKEACNSLEASSSESYSSPSVRERFSKLILPKAKDKFNQVGDRTEAGESPRRDSAHGAQSLPSPRNLFSFLTKSADKKVQPSAEEEDDEQQQRKGCRDLAEGQQTPSARRQKAALRAAKQAEHKRLRIAQEVQRQLEECEIKTRELEDKGIRVEKALRGETENVREETDLMRDWFSLVHEKNALSRWEQELTVKARELQLEDRHMRLENELRQRMACPESEKKRYDIDREGGILAEMLGILEQKDSLVSLLEEDRKRYLEEDKDLKKVMEKKGLRLPNRQRVV